MTGIFSELSTSLNKSSAAKSTNNRPLQNLSALDHHSDLISHHDRQKLPISALIQSKRVKAYTMAHIISIGHSVLRDARYFGRPTASIMKTKDYSLYVFLCYWIERRICSVGSAWHDY